MDDRHPKRRKDKYNPYTLSLVDGKCYLSFKDGQGFPHKLELDVKLYALFDRFELDDLSFLNEQERHLVQTELSEALLSRRVRRIRPQWKTLFMNPYRHRHFEKESGGCRKSRKEGCRCISLMDSPTKKLRNGKDAAIKRYRSP